LCEEIERYIDKFYHYSNNFESFLTIFQEKVDITCKLTTPRTTKRNNVTNPWITHGLINSIEKKRRLYVEWNDTCTLDNPDGDLIKKATYKKYNTFLKLAIDSAKSSLMANKFEKCKGNSKKTWKLINEIRGKSKAVTKDDFIIDGQRVTCRRIIDSKFNEYFTSLATNLNEQVPDHGGPSSQPTQSLA
jgi:hypothetical protein